MLDDAMLESLEELLITADMGVETALKLSARLAEGRFGKRVSTDEIKQALAGEIARVLEPVARPLPLTAKRPQVVLVVGVNGSGKTTTIGKLASQLKAAGKSVVIAAGDTFRAAAVEQLQIWRIARSTPEPMASTSMLALSVSISSTASPISTASPSCFSHWRTRPSSMVGDSLDIRIRLAIDLLSGAL